MPSSENKRIAKNTLILYFRMFLIMGVTLYTSRIVLEELGVVDYGIYNVVGGVVAMLSFLNGGMTQASQRFLSFELGRNDEERLRRTFKTSFTIHLIMAGVVLIAAETIGLWFLNYVMTIPANQLDAANWVYQCSILSFIVYVLRVPFNAVIIAREHMQIFGYVSILEVILKLAVAFSISIFSGEKLKFYAVLILLVIVIINLIYQWYCKRHFKECVIGLNFEKGMFRSMSGFAVWSTLGSLAWTGKNQGCNIILNLFYGPSVNAAYGIANQVNSALNSFVQNFSTAVNPQIVKSYSVGDFSNMQRLVVYGSKISFFLILMLSYPILLLTKPIMSLWLVNVPEYAVIFTQLVIINTIIESFSYSMGAAIQATGKIKWYQMWVGLTLLLNLPLSYFLLQAGFAPPVIYIISIILSLLTISERLLLMKRNIPEFALRKFISAVFFPAVLIIILCGIMYAGIIVTNIDSFLPQGITVTLSIISLVVVTYFIGFNRSERVKLCQLVKARIKRK